MQGKQRMGEPAVDHAQSVHIARRDLVTGVPALSTVGPTAAGMGEWSPLALATDAFRTWCVPLVAALSPPPGTSRYTERHTDWYVFSGYHDQGPARAA